MPVTTSTSFDIDALKRGYEEWDIDALLALYADDVELIQIDRDNPAPRAPAAARTSSGGCSSTAPAPA
jgi:ketosteroid isomerase-like protein